MEKIDVILDYIETNYQNVILLENVAMHVGLSRNYLSKYFVRKMKIPFTVYVNDLKIEKACRLLKETNERIESVCFSCGYNTPSFFYVQFKKRKYCAPSRYR